MAEELTEERILALAKSPDNAAVELLRMGWMGQGTAYEFTRAGNGAKAMEQKLSCMTATALHMSKRYEELLEKYEELRQDVGGDD